MYKVAGGGVWRARLCRACLFVTRGPTTQSMAMEFHRVRLQLDFSPTRLQQRCWFLYNVSNCRTVSDLAHLIAQRFGISNRSSLRVS